jgi:hypothetical protein
LKTDSARLSISKTKSIFFSFLALCLFFMVAEIGLQGVAWVRHKEGNGLLARYVAKVLKESGIFEAVAAPAAP